MGRTDVVLMAHRVKHRNTALARRWIRVTDGKPADPSQRGRSAKKKLAIPPCPSCARTFKTLLPWRWHRFHGTCYPGAV